MREWMATTVIVGNIALLEEANISLPAMTTAPGARVLVARDGRFIGSIHIADQVRDGASEAIRELHAMGIQIELLTGDTEASARAVAERIGIRQVSSGLLPEQKSARVDELIHLGRNVAMIGDGINDAPALSHAHVGVAMGSGTEIAHASANVLAHRKRSEEVRRDGQDCPLVPRGDSPKLLRNAGRGCAGYCFGGPWNDQPPTGGFYPRLLRVDVHSELDSFAAPFFTAATAG